MNIVDDVKNLLIDFNLYQIPIRPTKVAEAIGVQYVESSHEGFEGTLVVVGDNAIISVNSNIREEGRKAFTCAHELGHYQYDISSQKSFKCTRDDTGHGKDKLDPKEIRANEFASELLMPTEFFLREIEKPLPSWDLISRLSTNFGTSLQAAANKYVRLAHHACWLVVVKNGKLQRFSKADFNEFPLNLNGTFRAPKNVTGWQEVSASMWLYDNWRIRGKAIQCWPLAENQYGESIVLLWDSGNKLSEDSFKMNDEYDDDDDY